jgi:hypothetical protein
VIDKLVDKLIAKFDADLVNTLKGDGQKEPKVLIVDKLEYAQEDLPLAEVKQQLDLFKETLTPLANDIENIKNDIRGGDVDIAALPILAATVAVPSLISTLAGVAGYFQTNYSVTGQEFALPTEGLLAAVATKLSTKVDEVYISNFYAIGQSGLLKTFMELKDDELDLKTKKDELANQVAKPLNDRIATLNKRILELEAQRIPLHSVTDQAKIEEIKSDINDLENELRPSKVSADRANAAVQEADVCLTAFQNFTSAITSSADGQPSKLARAMLRDKVYQAPVDITHILYLKILYSGGNAITAQNRWSSGKTSYMGGLAFNFVLAEKDGKVVASDTFKDIGVLDYTFSKKNQGEVRRIPVSQDLA